MNRMLRCPAYFVKCFFKSSKKQSWIVPMIITGIKNIKLLSDCTIREV